MKNSRTHIASLTALAIVTELVIQMKPSPLGLKRWINMSDAKKVEDGVVRLPHLPNCHHHLAKRPWISIAATRTGWMRNSGCPCLQRRPLFDGVRHQWTSARSSIRRPEASDARLQAPEQSDPQCASAALGPVLLRRNPRRTKVQRPQSR